jgi:hypothetical protein
VRESEPHARAEATPVREGQPVSVAGRPARVIYLHRSSGAAVVRYDGERETRVVALRKLRLLPESD